jgi:hypothetical protein
MISHARKDAHNRLKLNANHAGSGPNRVSLYKGTYDLVLFFNRWHKQACK